MTDAYFDDKLLSLTTNDLWLRQRNEVFELKWPSRPPDHEGDDASFLFSYNESVSWEVIAAVIERVAGLDLGSTTATPPDDHIDRAWLLQHGIEPFAVIATQRTRYPLTLTLPQQHVAGVDFPLRVNVDIDKVTFEAPGREGRQDCSSEDSGDYHLGEVELLCSLPEHCVPSTVMAAVLEELSIRHPATAPLSGSGAGSAGSAGGSNVGAGGGSMARRGKVEEFLLRYSPEHHRRVFGEERCGVGTAYVAGDLLNI